MRQRLDVDAFGGQVLEVRAVDRDVGRKAVAGLAGAGVLGEINADVTVDKRAAIDREPVDVGAGALLDADHRVGDIDVRQGGVAGVAGEADAVEEAIDVYVREGDIVRRDGDAVAGRAAVGVVDDPSREIPGDTVVAFERAVNGDLAEADEAQAIDPDRDVLVVSPRRDHDRVAGRGGVNRRLDGGVAAVADEQEVVAGAVDHLHAGKRVGTLGATGGDDEVAGSVIVDRRGADRGGVHRGVVAGPAVQRVVAVAARRGCWRRCCR